MVVPANAKVANTLNEPGVPITLADGTVAFARMFVATDEAGNVVGGSLPACTNRSGTATTTSGGLNVPANANRKGLVGQNIGANNIGFNEFGGTAAIGTAGTYTVAPGASFSISTSGLVNFVAATASTAVTLTEY